MAKKQIYIIDPCLRDYVGHHLEYDKSLAEACKERNIDVQIVGHRDFDSSIPTPVPVRAAFRLDIWQTVDRSFPKRRAFGTVLANLVFFSDLFRNTKSRSTENIIFAHMVTQRQLLGCGLYALFSNKGDSLIVLLRYQPEFYQGRVSRIGFRLLECAARFKRVRLAADSARLARAYQAFTRLPVEVFPIPHTVEPQAIADRPRNPLDPLTFASLGDARDEKGIFEIIQAIRILQRKNEIGNYRFVLQVNSGQPDVQAEIEKFKKDLPAECTLIGTSLPSDKYKELLNSADFILVPYWRSIYHSRTSGVFFEALSAGKPVIATNDTWMSDQLRTYGAGILCADRNAGDLVRAMRQARAERIALGQKARDGRTRWVEVNSAAALARVIETGPEPRIPAIPPGRIAVLYPWGDFTARRAGASRRSTALVDFLYGKVAEIRILQGDGQPASSYRGLPVESHPIQRRRLTYLFREAARLVLYATLAIGTFGRSRGQEEMLWLHLRPRFDPGFAGRIRELVQWADLVLLEYPFWAKLVMRFAQEAGTPVILTNHDVLSAQVTRSRWLRRLTESLEKSSMLAVPDRVTVSEPDQLHWIKRGIPSVNIPNPVDINQFNVALPTQPRDLLNRLYDLPMPTKDGVAGQILLFVGSSFSPNIVAAQRLRVLAQDLAARMEHPPVVVLAGKCAPPSREHNFTSLGSVDELVLTALYQAAAIVLIPLPFGTGTSVKTIEAMAASKPVIGTVAAFRGLDVVNGTHCLVEDDLSSYAELIPKLLQDPDRLRAIGAAARQFAESRDYRKLFSGYLPLMRMTDPPHEETADPSIERKVTWAEIGELALRCQKADLAVDAFRRAIDENPSNAAVIDQLGHALASAGEDEEARTCFDRARGLGYNSASAAEFYSRLDGTRQLSATMEPSISNDDAAAAEADAQRKLTALKSELWSAFSDRQYDAVIDKISALLDSDARDGEFHFLLAQSLHNQGRELPRALTHYSGALARGFDPFWVRLGRGRVLRDLSRLREARWDFFRASLIRPGNREAVEMLAWVQGAMVWRQLKPLRNTLRTHARSGEPRAVSYKREAADMTTDTAAPHSAIDLNDR